MACNPERITAYSPTPYFRETCPASASGFFLFARLPRDRMDAKSWDDRKNMFVSVCARAHDILSLIICLYRLRAWCLQLQHGHQERVTSRAARAKIRELSSRGTVAPGVRAYGNPQRSGGARSTSASRRGGLASSSSAARSRRSPSPAARVRSGGGMVAGSSTSRR